MRLGFLAAPLLAAVIHAIAGGGDARAFTSSMAQVEKTRATTGPGGPAMSPYGAKLHHEVITEIRRNVVPFRLIAPARVVVVFAVDRRGALVHLSVREKTRSKLIDDYGMAMVRQASRRFEAPPANEPGEPLAFVVPINLQ